MRANTNLTHAECADRARMLAVQSYRIELDLSRAADTAVETFLSRTTLRFTATGEATWVDLVADGVRSATLNGTTLDVSGYDGARLPVQGLAEQNELVVEADCLYGHTGEGLHRFTDPEDGLTYLYTHFEPTDARRMFACFEQPDLKAEITTVLTGPKDWQLLAGQPEVDRQVNGELATVTFAPTPPLSTYITAVAAGPYHCASDQWQTTRADGSEQTIELRAFCRASMADHLPVDDIFTVTKQGLGFFDEKFGYPYPWGKYDQIFVPEYNLGAMENPGLVTFADTYIVRGTPTMAQRESLAEVTLHEMTHMWFGDLATMRWWDGLWLKESFADLMGYHAAAVVTEFDESWTTFASRRKAWAYRQDQLPTTHPVAARIDDMEAARQNFDGITYAKGASVVKQLMAYVGADEFFAATREYFARHAFGSTELGDLLDPLEKASGRDLRTWSKAWLETAGTPELSPEVTRGDDGSITSMTIVQSGVDPTTGQTVLRPHRLRVGLYRLDGDRLVRESAPELDVTGERTDVPQAEGARGDLVLVNDDDLTYAKVSLDEHSLAAVERYFDTIESTLSRGLVWSALWNATRDARMPAARLLDVVVAQAPRERDAAFLDTMLSGAVGALDHYLPEAERLDAAARLLDCCRAGLAAAEPDSDAQMTWATGLAHVAARTPQGHESVRAVLDPTTRPEGLRDDQELTWDLWTALVAQDAATPEEVDAVGAADRSMRGQVSLQRVRASRPEADVKAETWRRIDTDDRLTNDQLRALMAGFTQPSGAAITSDYAERYFDALTRWWSTRTMTMAGLMVRDLFPGGALEPGGDPEQHESVVAAQQWLDSHADAPAALRRVVIEQLDDLRRALRAQAAATGG